MANYDIRTVLDYRFGQLSGGVDSLATTLTSPDFATLPSDLTAVKYLPIVLADDSLKVFEIVWITGHAASSTSVTVVRAREGATARAWGAGALWRCAPTRRDVQQDYATRAALPADAHLGMRAFIVSENGAVQKTALGWRSLDPPFGHVGASAGFQSIADATNGKYVVFSAAQDLSGGMTFSDSDDALVVPITGRYAITARGYATGGTAYYYGAEAIINSVALPPPAAARAGAEVGYWKEDSNDYMGPGTVTRRLNAGDKVRLWNSSPNSTYGTTGYDGAWLELLYVGP